MTTAQTMAVRKDDTWVVTKETATVDRWVASQAKLWVSSMAVTSVVPMAAKMDDVLAVCWAES